MIENLQSLVSHADETPAGMELADLASESVIVCDVEGTIRYWNPASEALYGWPARAAVGRRLGDFAASRDFDAAHWPLLLRERTWRGPVRRRTAAGAQITASVRQTVRHDARGMPRDVVEYGAGTVPAIVPGGRGDRPKPRRVLTACLKLDVRGLHAHLEQNPGRNDGLLARARILKVDETLVRLFCGTLSCDEMIGLPVAQLWPAECREMLAELLAAVLTQGDGRGTQTRALNARGLLRDASDTAWRSLHRDPTGAVHLVISGALTADQTAWELQASEDRYRKLLHHMPTALWQVDARAMGEVFDRLRSEGVTDISAILDTHPELIRLGEEIVHVTEANRAAVLLFRGRNAADLIKPVRYLFAAAPETARRVMVAHFEGRRNYAERARILTFDGQLRDVLFSVTYPAAPEQLDTTFITILDITEQLQTESQLRQLQTDHAHAARISTLDELASSLAHEVKQPLAAIVTNGETSLRWLSRDDPNVAKVKQLTTRMVSSARRANDIIQRIRCMVVKGEPQCTPLDLGDVVEEALLFVRHDVESKAIALSVKTEPGLPNILGDRVQLQQVIVNLLVNSIQALAEAKPTRPRIELAVGRSEERGSVSVSIRDNGPGIADEILDRIFESFFTTKEGGMGIGLAICQTIVTAHDGRLFVSNHADGGAHFRFSVPALPAPPQG